MISSSGQKGFTLIEMIVSLGLFSVVTTIAVGALVALIGTNEQLQNERSVMTNLSFALDSMTREIRTGTNYYCAGRPNYSSGGSEAIFNSADSQETLGDDVKDCFNGKNGGDNLQGVSFVEGGDSITSSAGVKRILYFYDSTGGVNDGKIMRRIGDEPAQSIVSSGIYITDAEFFVTGSEPLSSGNEVQPAVTIIIKATDVDDPTAKEYKIQTTVTQRSLDL